MENDVQIDNNPKIMIIPLAISHIYILYILFENAMNGYLHPLTLIGGGSFLVLSLLMIFHLSFTTFYKLKGSQSSSIAKESKNGEN